MYKVSVTKTGLGTISLYDSSRFELIEITGLNPTSGDIQFKKGTSRIISTYQTASLDNKNIVLYIQPLESSSYSFQENRMYLNRYFSVMSKVTLTIATSADTYTISGYVETVEYSIHDSPMIMQVSIICDTPVFKSTTQTTATTSGTSMLTVTNNSGIVTEYTVTLVTSVDCYGVGFQIYDTENSKWDYIRLVDTSATRSAGTWTFNVKFGTSAITWGSTDVTKYLYKYDDFVLLPKGNVRMRGLLATSASASWGASADITSLTLKYYESHLGV